jgi:DNA-binding response OmpR family regulator
LRALIVEDDAMLRGVVARALRGDGYVLEEAATLAEGRWKSGRGPFELLIVDWNLPDGMGTELIAGYRAAGGSAGVIVITARDSIEDQVTGLESGADDFVSKPFRIEVLRARGRALLRRSVEWAAPTLSLGDLMIDSERTLAQVNDRTLDLTPKEWQLLLFLVRHAQRPAPRSEVVGLVWDGHEEPDPHVLDVHISHLRRKLAAAGSAIQIVTRRGAGYQLVLPAVG